MAINVKDKLVTVESLGIAYLAEQGARQEADQALSTRIDNIIAPEGDPSLSEVADARVSGSTTYNTLKARLDADKASVGIEIDELKADLDNLGGKGLTEAQIDFLDAIGDHINFSDSTGGALWDELIASLRGSSGIVFVKEGSSLIISGVNNIANIVKNGTVLELRGGV